jgi:hypothetical protein
MAMANGMGQSQEYDVVIIGGGLSGLTCGLYLQEAGMKVLILERSPQAGGLTGSWQVHEQGDADGKNFVRQYLKVTVGIIKDLNFVPRLVIFGHTHFLEYNAYKRKHLYVNTGSWRSTAFVDQEGRIVSVEDFCPYTEVNPVEDGGLPRVLCRRAADGRKIDIAALLKQHEKFGLKVTLGYH